MKFFLFILFIFFNTYCSFGQFTTCSKSANQLRNLKSAGLSNNSLIRMEKYDISYLLMNLNVSNTSTYIRGFVTQKGFFKTEIDSVLLELHPEYTIDSIILNKEKTKYSRENQLLKIPNKSKNFEVSIYYHGSIKKSQLFFMGGSGIINKMEENLQKKVTYTLSEPFSASEWWPSKQSLNDKIDSADLYFTTLYPNLVGSNGKLIEKKKLTDSLVQFHWKTNYPTTYYLFSFSVAPYLDFSFKTFIKEVNDSLLIQNYIYNDSNFLKKNITNIKLTGDYLKLYSKKYGVYPFMNEKYGHCLSTINGGMEHQTMTTILNFDPYLVAHELAHQWWGNHVTCGSFQDIWLNEGFATYSEYIMYENIFPNKKNIVLNSFHERAKTQKTGSVWVLDTLSESRIFSRELSYDKGASIIHTLRYIINNDSLFFEGLKFFQNKYAHSFARAIDFKNTIETKCNVNLNDYFNQWYFGEGYPIYSVKTVIDDSTRIHVNQVTTSSKTSLFTTPLELLLSRKNMTDTILKFSITQNNMVFTFPNVLNINYVKSVDPNNYIINDVSSFLNMEDTMQVYIKVYPNPTNKEISIVTKETNSYIVNLYDLNGNILKKENHNSFSKISLTDFKPGIYLIEILSDNKKYTTKIIVE